ncbi:MAG: HEAT repeat domain-containing protein [Planctomycetes bacterium]|nr:HEAT repeat domain-containing protein [Planctomycetota bacterium]
MIRATLLPHLLLGLMLAGCASSPTEIRKESVPEEVQREKDLQAADQRRRDFRMLLLQLDQAIDSYVHALAARGEPRADAQAERLERSIREMVLDRGPVVYGREASGSENGKNFGLLQAAAVDGTVAADQAIALAALGFSGVNSVMPTILAGAQLEDPFVADRAVLGLAILRAPGTPPGVFARIVEDPKHPEDGRVQAAWALYQMQGVSEDQGPYVTIYRRLLTEKRDLMPAGVLVSAVRGLGYVRDEKNCDVVAPMLGNPVPRLRMAACVALARMNGQKYAPDLIERIGPKESVQNVRLTARKALAELAGGNDYGYDVDAWRKAFERGQ